MGHKGELIVDGKSYDSPSGAAVAVVGHEMNGWTFWGFQSGDGTIVPLAALRSQLEPGKAGSITPQEDPPSAKAKAKPVEVIPSGALRTLVEKGIVAPGATVVATFKGGKREATVDADGCLHLDDGSVHATPSRAARAITGYATNGWSFWKAEVDGETVALAVLRDGLS